MNEEAALEGWNRFIGTWETEGAHPMLPGEAIRGGSTFEWLDGRRFVIWRAHYDHPKIPDAITIIGVTDGQRPALEGRERLGGRPCPRLPEGGVEPSRASANVGRLGSVSGARLSLHAGELPVDDA